MQAQTQAPKIWDIKLGIPIKRRCRSTISSIPPAAPMAARRRACSRASTNSPQCPVERATGLHEVWFRYDDEMEYVARARRSDIMVRQYQANSLAGQPIITSLLIDDDGLVQGYRVVNDPRVDAGTRIAAFGLADLFKGMALGKARMQRPAAGRRRAADRRPVREGGSAKARSGGLVTRVEARRYYKPGQFAVDPNDNRLTENLFESSARLEVYRPGKAAQERR